MTQPVCESIRERLSALLEGDLPPDERQAAEEHLRGCAGCTAEARALRETLEALRRLPRAEPPADLVARIARAVQGGGARRAGGRSRIRRHAVAMLLVVGLLVGIIRVIPHGPPLFGGRRAPSTAPLAPMQQAARPATKEAARVPAAKSLPPPERAPSFDRESSLAESEARRDRSKERKADIQASGPAAIGAVTAGADASAPAGVSSIDLLRHPRSDAAWVESMRRLIVTRPEDLVRGWKALDPKERAAVLAHWKRSAIAPGVAGDLDAAMQRAQDPDLRSILHALRKLTP